MAILRLPHATADHNLLFGILALQMDFISRDALVASMNAWALDKNKTLGQILLNQQALGSDEHDLLEALVGKHLDRHGHDAAKSLAALSSLGSARQELERITDVDVQASLVRVAVDPYTTQVSLAPSGTRNTGVHPQATIGVPPSMFATASLPRFRILRPHAKGGLGEVFVAQDEELHREVALKEIQNRHADHPESRSRFLLEAEITGGLEHPGESGIFRIPEAELRQCLCLASLGGEAGLLGNCNQSPSPTTLPVPSSSRLCEPMSVLISNS